MNRPRIHARFRFCRDMWTDRVHWVALRYHHDHWPEGDVWRIWLGFIYIRFTLASSLEYEGKLR